MFGFASKSEPVVLTKEISTDPLIYLSHSDIPYQSRADLKESIAL